MSTSSWNRRGMRTEIQAAQHLRESVDTRPSMWLVPSSCTGSCVQGRGCDCAADIEPERTVEGEHPWLWLLYGVAFVSSLTLFCWVAT